VKIKNSKKRREKTWQRYAKNVTQMDGCTETGAAVQVLSRNRLGLYRTRKKLVISELLPTGTLKDSSPWS